MGKYDADFCIALLVQKQRQIHEAGEARYPRRSDFSDEAVVAIKAHLGPWPRALERAGLKPPRNDGYEARMLEKRIAQKRRRTAEKIRTRADGKRSAGESGADA